MYFIFIKNLSNLKYDGKRILAATYARHDNRQSSLETLLNAESEIIFSQPANQPIARGGHDSQIIENVYFSDNLPNDEVKFYSER